MSENDACTACRNSHGLWTAGSEANYTGFLKKSSKKLCPYGTSISESLWQCLFLSSQEAFQSFARWFCKYPAHVASGLQTPLLQRIRRWKFWMTTRGGSLLTLSILSTILGVVFMFFSLFGSQGDLGNPIKHTAKATWNVKMIGGSNLWSQGKNPKLTPVLVVWSLLGHTAQRWHTRHTSFCCRSCRHNDVQGGGIMRSIQTCLVVHGRFRFSSSQWLVAVSVELWVTTGHGFPPTWRADWSPDAEMSLSNRHSIFFRADHCAWRCTPKMWWFNHFGYVFFRNSKNMTGKQNQNLHIIHIQGGMIWHELALNQSQFSGVQPFPCPLLETVGQLVSCGHRIFRLGLCLWGSTRSSDHQLRER